jgi:alkanesulfonate monooxygenase SsuD/methylene tetrahydromethanopterin reductase-like flavin-dependent oxidoreductase (luciferase family)
MGAIESGCDVAWPTDPGLGIGVTAGLEPAVARALAGRCADLGYGSLWSNDEPQAPGLETLSHFAGGAPNLDLGVGVLPLDRHPPAQIVATIERLGLDPARLLLGIGSGQLRPQLQPVADAIAELRQRLPDARIIVGTMRPALSRLGGMLADGVLLNWMLPAQAKEGRRWVAGGADEAGRPRPITALYVRTAVGPGAAARLEHEEGRYRGFDPAHFAAMDVPLGAVGIAADDRSAVVEPLAAYRPAVDLPIVRVLADRDLASLVAVAEAAAP